jgi:tRNA (guanine37-N1)-methyltransferase
MPDDRNMTAQPPAFRALALTLFPEMFPGPLAHSLSGKALEKGLWSLETMQIRDFSESRHGTVDDSPYGGGTGLVMKPDVVGRAIDAAAARMPAAVLVLPTPRGEPLTQKRVDELLAVRELIIVCGRYEGIDQRVIDHYRPLEVSLGDYVLSGGEIAALTLLDTIVRLLPGVIGKESAHEHESFGSRSADYAGLLEYPHYTRPPSWNGRAVPEVLLGGNHKELNSWRLAEARRPDLWAKYLERKK